MLRSMLPSRSFLVWAFAWLCVLIQDPRACVWGDWPGLLGPRRDGHASNETKLPRTVPKELAAAWELPAGQGYAGAAIRGQHAVLYQRDGNEDVVRLVDVTNGKVLWRTAFPASYRQGIDEDKGPRSVPLIVDEQVLLQSASGAIHCVSMTDGKTRWSRDLRKEYGAEDGYFGAGNSPLVSGVIVIVNVGAKKSNAGIVALSLLDGSTFWQATNADAGYASPILYPSADGNAGTSQIAIVPTRLTTYGMDPMTGRVLWEYPFGQRGPTVNAATPIVMKNGHVFQTSSYGIGYVSVEVGPAEAKVVQQGDALASQYATPVSVGDYVFGSDGREDAGYSKYRCLQPDTGKLIWEEIAMPICHTIATKSAAATEAENGSELLIMGIDGRIWLVPATDRGFQPIWQTRIPMGKYRALPALSNNRLLVRSSLSSDAKWLCFEL
ncbi:MAG: PQQ-like beta-propeller repeat protein [Pirellula sp.]|nr:PQQ-like beta-propeller repeat protein [Pirellula sp.]